MGPISNSKAIAVSILFMLTSAVINLQPSPIVRTRNTSLSQAVSQIQGWRNDRSLTMAQDIYNALGLDEYVFQTFQNGTDNISLYIGFYQTSKKVGAAHSPLVCFPGQGWILSHTQERVIETTGIAIHCSSMIVSKGQTKQLVIYWFQAFNKTASGTFLQKVYLLWAKFRHNREDNAFVRVTIPLVGEEEHAFKIGADFIKSFYPVFLKYIEDGK